MLFRSDGDVRLHSLNRAKIQIGMAANAGKIGGSIPKGFTPDVIERETIVTREPHFLLGLY